MKLVKRFLGFWANKYFELEAVQSCRKDVTYHSRNFLFSPMEWNKALRSGLFWEASCLFWWSIVLKPALTPLSVGRNRFSHFFLLMKINCPHSDSGNRDYCSFWIQNSSPSFLDGTPGISVLLAFFSSSFNVSESNSLVITGLLTLLAIDSQLFVKLYLKPPFMKFLVCCSPCKCMDWPVCTKIDLNGKYGFLIVISLHPGYLMSLWFRWFVVHSPVYDRKMRFNLVFRFTSTF